VAVFPVRRHICRRLPDRDQPPLHSRRRNSSASGGRVAPGLARGAGGAWLGALSAL